MTKRPEKINLTGGKCILAHSFRVQSTAGQFHSFGLGDEAEIHGGIAQWREASQDMTIRKQKALLTRDKT